MADLDDIYNTRIIELAGSSARGERLARPDASATAHSKLCGSTVTVDLKMAGGKVSDYGQTVKACLLGQAAAAVGPAAVGLVGEAAFGNELPKYGGLGAFGIQGTKTAAQAISMLPHDGAYGFKPGLVYNIESSEFIKKMDGASGAHSDIDGVHAYACPVTVVTSSASWSARAERSGSSNQNRLPWPTRLSTPMRPRINITRWRAIVVPRPVPP